MWSNLSSYKQSPEINLRLQRDLNPWPPWYRCDALPTVIRSRSRASSIYTRYCMSLQWLKLLHNCEHHFNFYSLIYMIYIICTSSVVFSLCSQRKYPRTEGRRGWCSVQLPPPCTSPRDRCPQIYVLPLSTKSQTWFWWKSVPLLKVFFFSWERKCVHLVNGKVKSLQTVVYIHTHIHTYIHTYIL